MKYQIKIANLASAPLAFVLHGIEAQTPEDALSFAKRWLEDVAEGIRERSSDDEERVEVLVDRSGLALTNVSPDEWPDEDQDNDEWEDEDDDSEDEEDEEDEDDEDEEDDEDLEWIEYKDDEPVEDGYAGGVAIYSRGLRALQRRDFVAAAKFFRDVIARYPDEHDLVEGSRRYLKFCERAINEK